MKVISFRQQPTSSQLPIKGQKWDNAHLLDAREIY